VFFPLACQDPPVTYKRTDIFQLDWLHMYCFSSRSSPGWAQTDRIRAAKRFAACSTCLQAVVKEALPASNRTSKPSMTWACIRKAFDLHDTESLCFVPYWCPPLGHQHYAPGSHFQCVCRCQQKGDAFAVRMQVEQDSDLHKQIPVDERAA